MIKAVIFDCFGVLVEGSLIPFCEKYFPENPEMVRKVLELEARASRGKLTYEEFLQTCAQWASGDVNDMRSFLDNNPPNEQLLEFIAKELKPEYKIGFLSNASDDWTEELFTEDQLALFDDIILSFQHFMSKPDVKIFELAAERLGLETTECLFVDDVEKYCEGARRAGMKVVNYMHFEQAKNDIQKALGV